MQPYRYYDSQNRNILRVADNAVIPADPMNADYQQFEVWVAQGNAPDPAPVIVLVPQSITKRQLLIEMATAGYISAAEALAAAQTGAVPSAVQTVINSLPATAQMGAQITWASMTMVPITDPLINAFAASQNLTQAQVNAFFTAAAQY